MDNLSGLVWTVGLRDTSGISIYLSLPESIMETCSVVLSFEFVNEILWCDHSNETSLAVLLHGTICFSIFYETKFRILLEFDFWFSWRLKG